MLVSLGRVVFLCRVSLKLTVFMRYNVSISNSSSGPACVRDGVVQGRRCGGYARVLVARSRGMIVRAFESPGIA